MTEIELKDLRIQEELSLGGLSVAVEKVGDNKVFRPLTITENGVYDGGMEDGKFIGYTPVTVDIKPNPVPLTVTENGVYENAEGFSPVTVDIQGTFQQYVNDKGNVNYLFQGATQEFVDKYVPNTDFSQIKQFGSMFAEAFLTSCPYIDTKKCTNATYMFGNCRNLRVVADLDFRRCFQFASCFSNCAALEELWIKNIINRLQVGSGATWGHLLTVESLIHLIYELHNGSTSRALIIGSVNLEKLANVYVRLVDITDEMRAEDDLIDVKLPFEVCESTDEGAMLIEDYVPLKNWELG